MTAAADRPPAVTGPAASREVAVERPDGRRDRDVVAVEAPLEIRVDGAPLAVTLRTPGDDRELAAGFLWSEAVVRDPDEIVAVEPCRDPLAHDPDNVVEVTLTAAARADRTRRETAERDLLATAACGLCGKRRIEHVVRRLPPIAPLAVTAELLRDLPRRLRRAQPLFATTGGVHAAGLFTAAGELVAAHEDVGRHNAVDKVIGAQVLAGRGDLGGHVLASSGRAGFEIVQKAAMARIPVVVAVGAASSLAVETAARAGMTLVSFAVDGRGNRHLG